MIEGFRNKGRLPDDTICVTLPVNKLSYRQYYNWAGHIPFIR
jgi:hypothetical protein